MSVLLSLAMIVKNEELVLGRILSQARSFCDEIVIVDTGSSDKTVEIAESFGASIYTFDWIHDFSAARNFAFSKCTHDWVMWLDADDVILEYDQQLIQELKSSTLTQNTDVVYCTYQIAFSPSGDCTQSLPRERFIRRSAGGQWINSIHEYYAPSATQFLWVNRLDISIQHRKPAEYRERSRFRNLDALHALTEAGTTNGRTWYLYGKELQHHTRYEEALKAYEQAALLDSNDSPQRYQTLYFGMVCLIELERYDEAAEWGMKALMLDTSRPEALIDLGVIHYRKKAFKQAVPLLMAATVAFRPNGGQFTESDYSWRPYHYLSLCYEGLGEPLKAAEMALKALPTMPDKKFICDNISCYLSKVK